MAMTVPDTTDHAKMFRPPVNRAMRVLDRPYFNTVFPIAAAKVQDWQKINGLKTRLRKEMLELERRKQVENVSEAPGEISKVILLKPEITPNDESTWSPTISDLVKSQDISIVPFDLQLDYNYWQYQDIMSSVLPEAIKDDYPNSFSIVGHVVHLNLREEHLPHKYLIASVLLDKVTGARTVINKIDEVGSTNIFRTFNYEVLAGVDDLIVEVYEDDCYFKFDYSKVYWNQRLNTEHKRMVNNFLPGEAICDVMAGVGPFAVPAGKKRCWVMANDLNPDSYRSLRYAVKRNKVTDFVDAYNKDGSDFIRSSTRKLLCEEVKAAITKRTSRSLRDSSNFRGVEHEILVRPKTFAHYVLNLPASAINFLPSFIGLYTGQEHLFAPETKTKLPLVHVYCFNTKDDDTKAVEERICKEISDRLAFEMKPGDGETEGEVSIWDVRDVAPSKRMFCATFRLPAKVAFDPR